MPCIPIMSPSRPGEGSGRLTIQRPRQAYDRHPPVYGGGTAAAYLGGRAVQLVESGKQAVSEPELGKGVYPYAARSMMERLSPLPTKAC